MNFSYSCSKNSRLQDSHANFKCFDLDFNYLSLFVEDFKLRQFTLLALVRYKRWCEIKDAIALLKGMDWLHMQRLSRARQTIIQSRYRLCLFIAVALE